MADLDDLNRSVGTCRNVRGLKHGTTEFADAEGAVTRLVEMAKEGDVEGGGLIANADVDV